MSGARGTFAWRSATVDRVSADLLAASALSARPALAAAAALRLCALLATNRELRFLSHVWPAVPDMKAAALHDMFSAVGTALEACGSAAVRVPLGQR